MTRLKYFGNINGMERRIILHPGKEHSQDIWEKREKSRQKKHWHYSAQEMHNLLGFNSYHAHKEGRKKRRCYVSPCMKRVFISNTVWQIESYPKRKRKINNALKRKQVGREWSRMKRRNLAQFIRYGAYL